LNDAKDQSQPDYGGHQGKATDEAKQEVSHWIPLRG
jgi:hypothetical protein